MVDILTNADKINRMIEEIEAILNSIPEAADEKAMAISGYDRELAITIIKIKNGLIKEIEDFDGTMIPLGPVTATERVTIAKGIIYQASLRKEAADAGYKGIVSTLDARKAQLNGLQSLNKVIQ